MDKVKLLEEKYPLEQVKALGHKVWPLIRFSVIVNYTIGKVPLSRPSISFRQVKLFFYGFFNLFRRYHFLAFSDSSERKVIEGRYFDKSIDPLILLYPKTLLFELPLPNHFSRARTTTRFIASKYPLYVLALLYERFILRKIELTNEELITGFNAELGVTYDYRAQIRKALSHYYLGLFLFRIYKPKAIFIQSAYTNTGLVKAFKERGVMVIEVQHGMITSTHEAYNVFRDCGRECNPHYLFSFGEREREIFRNNYFLPQENVIPVGHFYIDYIRRNTKKDRKLEQIVTKYQKSIVVSTQDIPQERRLITFLIEAARQASDLVILFVPRFQPPEYYDRYQFPSNMILVSWLNVYEAILQADFHSTIFSTCALEAPSLGTPNLLIDIDGLSRKSYESILTDPSATRYVTTIGEFLHLVSIRWFADRGVMIKNNDNLIKPGYQDNLTRALSGLLTSEQ